MSRIEENKKALERKSFSFEDNKIHIFEDISKSLAVIADSLETNTNRPRAKWIYTESHIWICSHCGCNPHKGTGFVPNSKLMETQWRFCNLCGAYMEDIEE